MNADLDRVIDNGMKRREQEKRDYFHALCDAMDRLAQECGVIFMGQSVGTAGTAISRTLVSVAADKKLELPVMEDAQLGMAIGLSLAGHLPVCIYPRINFLVLALNQLVLHLDKIPRYSSWAPKVIIRTSVATPEPLDPGVQHLGDLSYGIAELLTTVRMVRLIEASDIVPAYEEAVRASESTLLIEYADRYV